jgi:cytochrome b
MNAPAKIKVWDPAVRLFHWLLVAAFFIAYFTDEKDLRDIHVIAGYTVLGLVVFRVIWGFIGSRHARFSDFVAAPGKAVAYALQAVKGTAARYLGHNPAGGWMIIILLVSLLCTTGTGLAVYGADQHAGPLAGFFAAETTATPVQANAMPAQAGDDEDDDARGSDEHDEMHATDGESETEEILEELHEFFANFTIFLVVLHVLGVVVESRLHRENLARAMVTGYKRA